MTPIELQTAASTPQQTPRFVSALFTATCPVCGCDIIWEGRISEEPKCGKCGGITPSRER
jgi:hypothetical protein